MNWGSLSTKTTSLMAWSLSTSALLSTSRNSPLVLSMSETLYFSACPVEQTEHSRNIAISLQSINASLGHQNELVREKDNQSPYPLLQFTAQEQRRPMAESGTS